MKPHRTVTLALSLAIIANPLAPLLAETGDGIEIKQDEDALYCKGFPYQFRQK